MTRGPKPRAQPQPICGQPKIPRPPALLAGKAIAKREWRGLWRALHETGLSEQTHESLVLVFADASQDYHDASARIAKDGLTLSDGRGLERRHPATVVRKQALDTLLRVLAELGLSPSSRARIQPSLGSGDAFEALLRRRDGAGE